MTQIQYPEVPKPRRSVTPPHIPLAGVRIRLGLKQQDVCDQVALIIGETFTNASLSAIENGHRGASEEVLEAIQVALGLRPGDVAVDYSPGHSRRKAS